MPSCGIPFTVSFVFCIYYILCIVDYKYRVSEKDCILFLFIFLGEKVQSFSDILYMKDNMYITILSFIYL